MNNELKFENNTSELTFGAPQTKIDMNYNNADNKPSINGVELVGNLTTEDLKIQAGGSDIELITELKPESIEEELKDNQVYNGNAIHDLARLFGERVNGIDGLVDKLKEKTIFDVSCTISLTDMEVSNVSNFSKEIIEKRNEGNLIRLNCIFKENPNLKVVCILNVIDNNYAFFYPLIRGDIGQGMKTYLFRLSIGLNSANITAHPIPDSIVNIIKEFDIEGAYSEEDVFNANAIIQLLGLFVDEITQIQKGFETLSNNMTKIKYIDTNKVYLDSLDPGVYYSFQTLVTFYGKSTDAYGDGQTLYNPIFVVFNKNNDDLEGATELAGMLIKSGTDIKNYIITRTSSGGISNKATSSIYVNPMFTSGAQSINGVKTFKTLPETSVVPTTDKQLTNKAYVDSAIDSKITQALEGEY